jgi:hypothetical protein
MGKRFWSVVEYGSPVIELETSLDEIHFAVATYAFRCWPVSWRS